MKTLNELETVGVKFAVIRRDETYMWRDDIADKAGKIECVYLVNLTEPTYLCELAISFPAEELKNFIPDSENSEKFTEDELTEIESENAGAVAYFHATDSFEVAKEYTEGEYEDVLEYERGNPTVC